MENVIFRFYIKTQYKLGKQATEIFNQLKTIYNHQAPSYATGARWVTLFKNGGNQSKITPAQAAQLQGLLKTTLKPLVRLSWKTLIQLISKLKPLHSLSRGTIYNIIHEHLKHDDKFWLPSLNRN